MVTRSGSTDIYTFTIIKVIKEGEYLTNPELQKERLLM